MFLSTVMFRIREWHYVIIVYNIDQLLHLSNRSLLLSINK